MRGVVFDDIGTKVDRARVAHLQPTYRVETSPGNEQWGFAFEAPLTNARQAQRLLDGIKPWRIGRSRDRLVRWVRGPWGVNTKRRWASRSPCACSNSTRPDAQRPKHSPTR